jgi:acyl carrier protein
METTATIRKFVAGRLGTPENEIDLDVDLRSLDKFDSITALQVVLDVEQEFDIEIEDHVVFEVSSVREFAAEVERLVANSPQVVAQP